VVNWMKAAGLGVHLSLLAVASIALVAQAEEASLELSRDYDNVVVETFDWDADFVAEQVNAGGHVISIPEGEADWTLIETLHGADLHDPQVAVRVHSGALHMEGNATKVLSPHLAEEHQRNEFQSGVVSGKLVSLRASFEIVVRVEIESVTERLIIELSSARWGSLTWRTVSAAFAQKESEAWWYSRQSLLEHTYCPLMSEAVDSRSRVGDGPFECRIRYDVGSGMVSLAIDGRTMDECNVGQLIGTESLHLSIYTESEPPAEGPVDCWVDEVVIGWDDP